MPITLPVGFPKTPSTARVATDTNFVSIADLTRPQIHEELIRRYGSQRIMQDLFAIHGQEVPVAGETFSHFEDEFIYENGTMSIATAPTSGFAASTFTVAAAFLYDDNGTQAGGNLKHSLRIGDIIEFAVGKQKAVVTAVPANNTVTLKPFKAWGFTAPNNAQDLEFYIAGRVNKQRGTTPDESLTSRVNKYENRLMIMDDRTVRTGSELAEMIWVQVQDHTGRTGWTWGLKNEGDFVNRFETQCEILGLILGESTSASAPGATDGLITSRGYLEDIALNGGTLALGGSPFDIDDFRTMAKHAIKYGGGAEYGFYVGLELRDTIDQALGAENAYFSGGNNFGAFQNSEDMMLNLGFTGVKVLGVKFAVKTYELFNHPKLLGTKLNAASGSFDYDKWGFAIPLDKKNDADGVPRAAITTRFKELDGYSRYLEMWVDGAVNGVYTTRVDELGINLRAHRGWQTFAAIRHMLVTG